MKFNVFIALIATGLLFTACAGGSEGKKVIVMSSGKMQTDTKDQTIINFEPGNQHNDLELKLAGSVNSLTVKSPAGDKTYEIPDKGLYLLNLKSDTMIGNKVNFGEGSSATSIDAEQLQNMIDSTQQLLTGQNADYKTTFFLVPNSIKKVSDNQEAQLLSPYQNIPYEVKVDKDGNAPEMYKFFTNKQKREALDELIQRITK